MLRLYVLALSALAGHVAAQTGTGIELDLPMLGGAPSSGAPRKTAMLRFGCSQIVIERIDPLVIPQYQGSPQHKKLTAAGS